MRAPNPSPPTPPAGSRTHVCARTFGWFYTAFVMDIVRPPCSRMGQVATTFVLIWRSLRWRWRYGPRRYEDLGGLVHHSLTGGVQYTSNPLFGIACLGEGRPFGGIQEGDSVYNAAVGSLNKLYKRSSSTRRWTGQGVMHVMLAPNGLGACGITRNRIHSIGAAIWPPRSMRKSYYRHWNL